jgi:L-2,4-diaminobutyrate decarboxylase
MTAGLQSQAVHGWSDDTERLAGSVFEYARYRLRLDPVPLDGPRSQEDLKAAVGETVTPGGLGGDEALRVFTDVLAPACISIDHPRYLSFIPCAPTEAATIFDLIVGASSIYGGSWLEGAGAVFAENQALRWLADLAGFPTGAGGVFVQGGTIANLSALVAARYGARERDLASSRDGGGGAERSAGPDSGRL